jgi:hypothetical protein
MKCQNCGTEVEIGRECETCGRLALTRKAEEPKPLDVKIDPHLRVCVITVQRVGDIAPVVFAIPFASVKAIAARVLDCEVAAESAVQPE